MSHRSFRNLFLVALILVTSTISTRVFAQSFYKAYGLTGNDNVRTIQILPGGDYIVGGTCALNGGDIYIARITPSGTRVWQRNYGGSREDLLYASTFNTNGNILFAGTTASLSLGSSNNIDIVVLEIDQNGNLIWIRDYGRNSGFNEIPSSISLTNNGIGIAGQSLNTGSTTPDMIAMEISNNGGVVNWQRIYEVGSSIGSQLISSMSGGYILIGSTDSGLNGYNQFMARLDASGIITTRLIWGSTLDESTHRVIENINGDIVVMGNYRNLSGSGLEFAITRLSSSNTILWSTTYGDNGTRNERGFSFFTNSSGNYVIGGFSNTLGEGGLDGLIVEVSPATGDLISSRSYGGSSDEFIFGMVENSDQSYTIAGSTASFGSGGTDINLVRTNVNGTIVNNCSGINVVRRVVSPSLFNESITSIALSLANNVSSLTTGTPFLTETDKPACLTLPIIFLTIKSVAVESGINTEWIMADQENVKSYAVEYSNNAVDFVSIYEVLATPDLSYSELYYTEELNKYNYIRIRCMTYDGVVFYSQVISIRKIGISQEDLFEVQPNPNQGDCVISTNSIGVSIYNIYVIDMLGNVIYNKSFMPLERKRSTVRIEALPKGFHFIKVVSSAGISTEKILVE